MSGNNEHQTKERMEVNIEIESEAIVCALCLNFAFDEKTKMKYLPFMFNKRWNSSESSFFLCRFDSV